MISNYLLIFYSHLYLFVETQNAKTRRPFLGVSKELRRSHLPENTKQIFLLEYKNMLIQVLIMKYFRAVLQGKHRTYFFVFLVFRIFFLENVNFALEMVYIFECLDNAFNIFITVDRALKLASKSKFV